MLFPILLNLIQYTKTILRHNVSIFFVSHWSKVIPVVQFEIHCHRIRTDLVYTDVLVLYYEVSSYIYVRPTFAVLHRRQF